jgi:hypothetical protein
LQGFSLKNRKSLQAQAWSKTVRFSAQSISFGTGSHNLDLYEKADLSPIRPGFQTLRQSYGTEGIAR